MKKLISQALVACLVSVAVVFSPNLASFAQASVPPTGQTNTGLTAVVPTTGETNTGATATTPLTGQTNTGEKAGTTVPATGEINTGSNAGATVPPTGQTNTGSNAGATVPPTGQTNTGSSTSVPPVEPPANPQYSSGSGGAIIPYSSETCSSVTYSEWGAPVNGYQYRDVASQAPAGCTLSAAQQEARSRKSGSIPPQILGVKDYVDGSLLRGPDYRIYVVIDGRKQLVKNWGELYKKYGGKKITDVSFEVLAQYPEVLGVKTYADGSLLRGPDKKIYLLVYSRKKHIKNLAELANYQDRKITEVSFEVLAQYPEVSGVKVQATGNLYRGSDEKIYLLIDGQKKLIRNLQELINYRGREITNVDDEILAGYPQIY